MKEKLKKLGIFIIGMYLVNKITFWVTLYIGYFIYYPFNVNYLDGTANMSFEHLSLRLIFLPIHPMYSLYLTGVGLLNLIVFILYRRFKNPKFDLIEKFKLYFSLITLLYILGILIFVLFSIYNNFSSSLRDNTLLKLLFEPLIPYSPSMTCGFLIGNFIFAIIWIGLIERYIFDKPKKNEC